MTWRRSCDGWEQCECIVEMVHWVKMVVFVRLLGHLKKIVKIVVFVVAAAAVAVRMNRCDGYWKEGMMTLLHFQYWRRTCFYC